MSESFTKLFSSIVDSTIWAEDDATRIVWVTMLAMADQHGYVGASVPGLAGRARVTLEKTLVALEKLSSPDPFSRSKEHEGRRIREVDRGWLLLNYKRFRDARDEEVRREYERLRKREQRSRTTNGVPSCPGQSGTSPESPEVSAQAEAEADPVSGSSPPSLSSVPDPAGARSTTDANPAAPWPAPPEPEPRVWPAHVWHRRFSAAWSEAKGTAVGPGGGAAAARATADLGDLLGQMTEAQRLEAQGRAPAIFAEYLGDQEPKILKVRHPWAWFVVRFNGLLVPDKEAPTGGGDIRFGHADQRTIERPSGDVQI